MSLTRTDFGKVVARDPRTGDVYLDKDGNLVTIEGLDLVIQECRVALESMRGEDIFDNDWGFPLMDVLNNPWNLVPELLITQAITETLSPEKIPILDYVEVTNIKESSDEEGEWYVEILIRSINNDEAIIGVDLPDV